MGRKRVYDTPADRYKAYRDRKREGLPSPVPAPIAKRKPARPARLAAALAAVEALRDEYQAWFDGLPSNLAGSDIAGKLTETVDHLSRAVESLEQVDPPMGFGRD